MKKKILPYSQVRFPTISNKTEFQKFDTSMLQTFDYERTLQAVQNSISKALESCTTVQFAPCDIKYQRLHYFSIARNY